MRRRIGMAVSCALTALILGACEKEAPPEARPIAEAGSKTPDGMKPAGDSMPNEILLEGKISVDEKFAEKVPEGATLFLMGRPAAQGEAGPPVLVKKIHPVVLPANFKLTGGDTMMAGREMPASFHLSARLDQDGDAISRTPGDLTGMVAKIDRGASEIELVLSELIEEPKPAAAVE